MNNIRSLSSLELFKAEKYSYSESHMFDVSTCPRPHYCLGFVTAGEGVFEEIPSQEKICVTRGDMIFVPMGSKYCANWHGSPEISYISMHFVFERSDTFPRKNRYKLQKIRPRDTEKYFNIFTKVKEYLYSDVSGQFSILGDFYNILSEIHASLTVREEDAFDPRLEDAVKFIEENFSRKITVEEIAVEAKMSVSRFFPYFKKQLGVTPVDYINNYRVSQAALLLMNEEKMTVEDIAEKVGFESSAYFRRVFKKVTGHSPREYKKNSLEL